MSTRLVYDDGDISISVSDSNSMVYIDQDGGCVEATKEQIIKAMEALHADS